MITVITRTSARPRFFEKCRQSVLNQTRKAFHIVTRDDPKDTYQTGDTVANYFKWPGGGRQSNLYFNYTHELDIIPDEHPFVMFLDDDDHFFDSGAIEAIEAAITSDDDLLLWQVGFPEGRLVPGDGFGKPPVPGNITGIGFCYHKKHWVDWPPFDFGDYMVISQLYMKLRPVWIPAVLTAMQIGPGMGQRLDLEA